MSAILDAVSRIHNRINRFPPQAVFIDAGRVRSTQATKQVLDKLASSKNLKLVGVYDERCPEDWLEGDLVWVEERLK